MDVNAVQKRGVSKGYWLIPVSSNNNKTQSYLLFLRRMHPVQVKEKDLQILKYDFYYFKISKDFDLFKSSQVSWSSTGGFFQH